MTVFFSNSVQNVVLATKKYHLEDHGKCFLELHQRFLSYFHAHFYIESRTKFNHDNYFDIFLKMEIVFLLVLSF